MLGFANSQSPVMLFACLQGVIGLGLLGLWIYVCVKFLELAKRHTQWIDEQDMRWETLIDELRRIQGK